MKIEAPYQQQGAAQTGMPSGTRQSSDSERKPGDVIKGEIIDVRQNAVTIRSDDGKVMTARASPPQEGIKAGQHVTVRLATDENGEPTFEFPKTDGKAAGMQQRALDAAGLAATPENIKLIDTLLANNSPIDKATIQKMIQAVRLVGLENIEKALFIMENDMKPTARAIEKLDGYINGSTKISNQLQSLANEIMALPEGTMKEKLQEILFRASGIPLSRDNVPSEQGGNAGAQVLRQSVQTGVQAQQSPQAQLPPHLQTTPTPTPPMQTPPQTQMQTLMPPQTLMPQEQSAVVMPPLQGQEPTTVQNGQTTELPQTPIQQSIDGVLGQSEELKQHIQRLVSNAEVVLGAEDKAVKELKAMLANPDADPSEIERLSIAVSERKRAEESTDSGKQKIMKHLALGLKDALTLDEAESFLNNLEKKVSEMRAVLNSAVDETPELRKALDSTADNLEFMSQVKTGVYLQLPLIINNKQTNTELFVFKDKRGAKKQQGSSSALISLDLANLGHFETYVQKTNRNVECQFRVMGVDIESLVRKNLPKLEELLKNHGYYLSSTQFKQPDQAFTVLDNEPDDKIELDTVMRFSFDSKV